MLRLFDPTLEQQGSPQEEQLNLIPIYRNPKIQGAHLPGKIDQSLELILIFFLIFCCHFLPHIEKANF